MSPICFSSTATSILAMRDLLSRWQDYSEAGAFAGPACDAYRSPVCLENSLGDDQPQTGSPRFAHHRAAAPEELGEQLRLFRGRHADTRVPHHHLDLTVPRGGRDADLSGGGVLDGVRH